jgi:hypothetical protein
MRKFTFFLVLVFAVLVSNGQNSTTLQKRAEAAKKKYSRVSHQNALLTNAQMKWNLSLENSLKSAAATMKLDSTISKAWDEAAQALVNDTKEEFLYDSEMKNTTWLYSDWDDNSGMWDVWSKTEVEYNPDGTVETMRIYESDEQGTQPILINKLNTFYNEAGQLDSVQHWYTEDQVTWSLEGKQIYHYNNSGQVTEMEMWALEEDEGEEYMTSMRYVFTYTNSGRMETSSMFFLFEGEEMLFFKTEYNYDNSDRLDFTEDWSIGLTSFELEKDFRTDYEFNASGDISTESWSEWDPSGQTWVETEIDEYSYNDFNYSDVFFPSYLMLYGIVEEIPVLSKAPAEIETMEWIEGSLELSYKTIFYYSDGTNTFASNLNEAGFSVYPNPVQENVTFNWSQNQATLLLEIYQVTGSRIFEKQIISGFPVSLAEIDNGMYFFKLNNGKQTLHSGKLIKK